MKRWILFFLIFVPIVYWLTVQWVGDPHLVPQNLINKPAPHLSLKTLDQKEISLDSLKGNAVVMNFWATWCGPCVLEHRVIQIMRDKLKREKIVFLGVVYNDTPEAVAPFLQAHGEAQTVLFDTPDMHTARDYGVTSIPETFFIDANGILRAKYRGLLTEEILEEKIQAVIPTKVGIQSGFRPQPAPDSDPGQE